MVRLLRFSILLSKWTDLLSLLNVLLSQYFELVFPFTHNWHQLASIGYIFGRILPQCISMHKLVFVDWSQGDAPGEVKKHENPKNAAQPSVRWKVCFWKFKAIYKKSIHFPSLFHFLKIILELHRQFFFLFKQHQLSELQVPGPHEGKGFAGGGGTWNGVTWTATWAKPTTPTPTMKLNIYDGCW